MQHATLVALAVLVLARFALGVQFQAAGSVAPLLVPYFGIDFAMAGGLVGLFWLPGLLLALPSGFLGRRFGERRVVLAGLALLAAGGCVSAVAEDHLVFGAGRLVSGAGAAVLFALLMKMISDRLQGPQLFIGMSVFIVGWPVGIALAQSTLGPLAELAGSWRAAAFTSAAFVAVTGCLFAICYRAPGPSAAASVSKEAGVEASLTMRDMWLVSLAGMGWMFINGAYLVLVTFGPMLLADRQGGTSGLAEGLPVSLMSWIFLIALPLGGFAAARVRWPRLLAGGSLAISTLAAAAIPFVSMDAVGMVFLLHGFTYAFAAPVIATQPVQALRPEVRGPGLGIYYLWYYAGCTALPSVAGRLKDLHGSGAPIAFAVAMLAATVVLMGVFAAEHRRLAATSE